MVPRPELINHFRPFLLVASALLLGAAWISRTRGLVLPAAALTLLTLGLALAPFGYRASMASGAEPAIKIVTLNLWVGQPDVETVARFLEREKADVVVLQEADRLHGALIERVKATYPHAYCPDRVCSLALLARMPWIEAGKENVAPRHPLIVRARFALGTRIVEVIGTHLSYPFESMRQAEQTEWLIDFVRRRPGPLVVAGDFNLTPFSWKLLKFMHRTGLRPHVVEAFSWPAHRFLPVVLLDNVLATPDLATVSARTGEFVGSDHRPVIVELAWR